jgi:negative regulator of replication initiation
MSRTTIVLDERSEDALAALTKHYGCSASEAIRRALVQHRERALGVPEDKRRRRKAALEKLIEVMDGHDWQAEISRLKEEDEWS